MFNAIAPAAGLLPDNLEFATCCHATGDPPAAGPARGDAGLILIALELIASLGELFSTMIRRAGPFNCSY